jgi:demethylmenaquinone methyltransferase/2-methoxy-6-polyprenyl-1,4-benzoquinol methylase
MPLQEPKFVRNLFSSIASRYDLANHLLSGGMDFFWRRRAALIVRAWHPRTILDLATGSGDLALTLSAHCPDSRIIGADFCLPMLLQAKAKGVPHLIVADGMRLPFAEGTFDVLTVAFGLRNMESWPAALKEMSRVLRKGGHLLVLDFSIPENRALGAIYRFYLHRMLPRIAGLVTREKSAYDYLADSIEKFPRGAAMTSLMNASGFCDSTCEPLTCGIVSLYTGRRG